MTYLLDTNVLSETRKRNADPGVREWMSGTPLTAVHLSALTIGEVGRGITKVRTRGDGRQADVFAEWLDNVVETYADRIAPVTVDVARAWADQDLATRGSAVDQLIAATAKVHGWTVITRNTKDFEHTGVAVINPFTG
ncbi:hypothetical protein EV193_105306 [Herbihabitans rhizosphaerae]|uniref:Ribonuclease VapC n=1 Tax=Herbihabitans rhizosphaerae TaxID=1872711 RepID=A0A4Q7KM48_9PSEU|nr:type II toxin-antitoxin system VapC family toxin [Herbihabitans rhizosphaerae]RZS37748.1 hypothetical protein EV193_105306 [Herbihabitans rhizosphaerae]